MFDNSGFSGDLRNWTPPKTLRFILAFRGCHGFDTLKMPSVVADDSNIKQLVNDSIETFGLTCDLNFIDVSQVTNMSRLFYKSIFKGKIDGWNVSNVTDMSEMFAGSRFNGVISQWDVSKVNDMKKMFAESRFNGDIDQWNVSSLTENSKMF